MSKLYIIMVGLPARGKSTIAQRLFDGLAVEGISVRLFNNGVLRRQYCGGESSLPAFYHPDNAAGRAKREELAVLNARSAKEFLAQGGNVAILDATNAGRARRQLMETLLDDAPILYIECINDDKELLAASVQRKAKGPEFASLTYEEAVASFYLRMEYYERLYTPLQEERCFVRVDTYHNSIIAEQIDGHVPHYILIRDMLVADWVGQLFLVRHGESVFNTQNRIGGDSELTQKGRRQAEALADHFRHVDIPYIFTSKRIRSQQYAFPLKEQHPEAKVIVVPELDEINAGICENMRYDDIRKAMPKEYLARSQDKYHYIYPGGEGYVTLRERVERGFRKALYLAGGQPGIVLIGHQAINRMILSLFLFRRKEDVPYIYVPQNQYFYIEATHRRKLFELIPFIDSE